MQIINHYICPAHSQEYETVRSVFNRNSGNLLMAALLVLPVSAVVQPNMTTPATTTAMMPGSDRDSHGCIGSAGYTWCEAKQKCLREWEEPCTASSPVPPGTAPPNQHPGAAPAGCRNCWYHFCLRSGGAHKETVTPYFFGQVLSKKLLSLVPIPCT